MTEGAGNRFNYVWTVLKQLKRNSRFDLVICGHIHLAPLVYPMQVFLKTPSLLVLHGIEAWQSTKRWLVNRFARLVNYVVCVSALTQNRFLNWAKPKAKELFILPNCVELSKYGPGPKKPELLQRYGLAGKKVLMTMGRLVSSERYKGFDEVLELLPELKKEIPEMAYLIVGDGNDRGRLEKKAADLGVMDLIVFTRFIPEEEKAEHYRLADVYVMPSRGEGFGIVYLEALACGIPVVGSNADGSREALRNGMLGILVDPQNQQEIKTAILEALAKPKKVPSGLDYYSTPSFQNQCFSILRKIFTLDDRNESGIYS